MKIIEKIIEYITANANIIATYRDFGIAGEFIDFSIKKG